MTPARTSLNFRRIRFFGVDDVDEPRRGRVDPRHAGAATTRLLGRAAASLALGLWLVALFVTGLEVLLAYDEVGRQSLPNWLLWIGLGLGAVLIVFGMIGVARWLPRIKSAQEGDWRPGRAGLLSYGERAVFITATPARWALPDVVFQGKQRIWVNGDEAVTIMFAYGPFLVAARRVR